LDTLDFIGLTLESFKQETIPTNTRLPIGKMKMSPTLAKYNMFYAYIYFLSLHDHLQSPSFSSLQILMQLQVFEIYCIKNGLICNTALKKWRFKEINVVF